MYRKIIAIQRENLMETHTDEVLMQKSTRRNLIQKVQKRLHEKAWYYSAGAINQQNTKPISLGEKDVT